jgi:hypothetical protein
MITLEQLTLPRFLEDARRQLRLLDRDRRVRGQRLKDVEVGDRELTAGQGGSGQRRVLHVMV